MDFKALLTGLLSAAYQMDETGVAALFDADGTSLKDDALTQILEKDKARVAKLTGTSKDKFDEGHKKGKAEALTQFEKSLKEKFEIDADAKGVELVEAIIAAKAPAAGSPGEITDEAVKKHKLYLDLKDQTKKETEKAVKEAVEAKTLEFNNYKSQVERGQSLSVVKQKALVLFRGLNPILSTDPAKAANQEAAFLRQFEENNYRIDGEKIVMLAPDGSDATDAHGNRVEFEAFVKDKAGSLYDFKVADPKGSPGAGGAGGGSGAGGEAKVIVKDEADFMKQYTNEKDPKKKIEISKAWTEVKAKLEAA